MAAVLQGLFGGSKPSQAPIAGDADFADFAGAPEPTPAAFSPTTAASFLGKSAQPTGPAVPYTKWYNIHERHSLSDFKQEGVILGLILIILTIHLFGTSTNKKKAKSWITAHKPVLEREFAMVGFGGQEHESGSDADTLKEKSPKEYSTYATGRQNVAFLDININLLPRYSPLTLLAEYAMSLFFESMSAPSEQMDAILYPFDGRESQTVPGALPGAHELRKDTKSSYDGFVWAVVNKETMKGLRDERYDVSITSTRDSPKLPNWATVMSESAEITDFLLSSELIKAVEQAGELLNHLIITDQPIDAPTKLDETVPKKRIYLSIRLPSSGDYTEVLPLFEHFLRLSDTLVASAHFRPEVLRKVKTTRDDLVRKLTKEVEDERAEERNLEREKAKKLKRDLDLKNLDAKGQKKYLEKEKEREMKKNQKKMTQR